MVPPLSCFHGGSSTPRRASLVLEIYQSFYKDLLDLGSLKSRAGQPSGRPWFSSLSSAGQWRLSESVAERESVVADASNKQVDRSNNIQTFVCLPTRLAFFHWANKPLIKRAAKPGVARYDSASLAALRCATKRANLARRPHRHYAASWPPSSVSLAKS